MLRLENFLISVLEKQGALWKSANREERSPASARRWVKSRKEGSYARASRPCPPAPRTGDSSDAAPSTVGAKGIRVQNTCALPAAAAVATARVCQRAELPPPRPLRRPGECWGRGGASTAPARLLLLSAAG